MDKLLIFDVHGNYAHFRKFYTTSSPLTFSLPPRTALQGLIGAITGLSKDTYSCYLRDARVSISLNKPLTKARITLNLINTKDAPSINIGKIKIRDLGLRREIRHEPHTPIRLEYLVNPSFRIYFWCDNADFMNKFKNFLINNQSVYTPYLGLANLVANIEFIKEAGFSQRELEGWVEIISPIRLDKCHRRNFLEIENGKIYQRERLPVQLDEQRIPTEYATYIFETQGKALRAKVRYFVEIKDYGNILWM